jgi:hypothetical protein
MYLPKGECTFIDRKQLRITLISHINHILPMKKLLALLLFGVVYGATAQDDDLLKLLDQEKPQETNYTIATFKSTRIINGHSIEGMAAKHLDFRISHRFGQLSDGAYNLWGLDQAYIRIALEYGLTNRILVGVGRSSYQKAYDGFVKVKLLRQSTGEVTMPVSVSLFGSVVVNTLQMNLPTPDATFAFNNRLAYTTQLLVARKLNERFSVQLTPTWVHRNYVETSPEPHDVFALGIGGRVKISKRVAFNIDYYHVFSEQLMKTNTNSLAVGFDIETGGHVFQLQFTNSTGMIEKTFITETTGDWGKGNIHYGFNISRTFSFDRKRAK